jgi:hypothetical protein
MSAQRRGPRRLSKAWQTACLPCLAREAGDGEHHLNQEAVFGVDHQFVDLPRILVLAIDLRPRSGRLTAPPRPVVSSATAEEQKQYDYYQDGFHIITSSPGWNEPSDIIFGKFYARQVEKRRC